MPHIGMGERLSVSIHWQRVNHLIVILEHHHYVCSMVAATAVNVSCGSNCEELTPGTHFRVAPNNRHGAAERKRPFAFLVPTNRCEPLLVRSLSIFCKFFWDKISFGRVAIAHQRSRRRLQMIEGRRRENRAPDQRRYRMVGGSGWSGSHPRRST
jgi:hypothetical protein